MSDKKLDADFVASQKKRLEELQAETEQTLSSLAESRSDLQGDSKGSHDQDDQHSVMALQERNRAKIELERERLNAIKLALLKVDKGTYGLSDRSGAAIGVDRLRAVPTANLTMEEANANET